MKKLLLFLFAMACLLPPALYAGDKKAEIGGLYVVEGRNAGCTAYSGFARLSEEGGRYVMRWRLKGGEQYEGTGTRDGNVLTIDWGSSDPVVYVILPNGDLQGTWAKGEATERLTPEKNI